MGTCECLWTSSHSKTEADTVVLGKRLGAGQDRLRFVRRDRRHLRARTDRGAPLAALRACESGAIPSCFELPSLLNTTEAAPRHKKAKYMWELSKSVTKGSYRCFQDSRPLALPQESPEPSRDMPAAHTTMCCVRPANKMVYTARRSEMPGVDWFSAKASVYVIHPHIRPFGSFGSAEVPTWCAIDIYDWAKPNRSPIFDVLR